MPKQFTSTEATILSSVIRYERETGRALPLTAVYKAIALSAVKRMGLSWTEVTELF